jgi:hypothetical protein
LDAAETMTQGVTMSEQDRAHINFQVRARACFEFLNQLGFSEIEASPTHIRYRKDSVEVDVYHGRRSFEIGAGISYAGTRYAIGEIIRAVDPEGAKRYGGALTSTAEGVAEALKELSSLMQRHGGAALRGDPEFFSTLAKKREGWVANYWLDGLAEQLRPQAEEAFHRGDYSKAAELYRQLEDRLSPAELKKLALADKRRAG